MILYNMRHRGPYEYDKLIQNCFQFHNEVINLKNRTESEDEASIQDRIHHIDVISDQVKSISEQILNYREGSQER